MVDNETDDRTLTRNSITSFLLRIDLIKTDQLDISRIAREMSKYFDRTEKRQISNVVINFTHDSSEVTRQESSFDYVLQSETRGISLVFSELQSAFWLTSTQYKNNSIYKELMDTIVSVITTLCGDVESRRIGMRYINDFKCTTPRKIGAIYGKRLASILRGMLTESYQSRIIGMEEYNKDEYKIRFQYGIPNKFYPSVITVFDLLMDIDSYIENTTVTSEWNNVVRVLNHAAYDVFKREINPKYLEELK